jgi:hypothetical protein
VGSVTLFAGGVPIPPGEDALTYYTPDGDFIPGPPEGVLRDLIFERGQDYYDSGWGGGALQVMRLTPQGIVRLNDQPSLEFFFIEPHGFFFRCYTKKGPPVVPYDGSGCGRLVEHDYGGDPMPVPVACFVPRQVAWEIVREFCRSRGCSPATTWVKWSELELPSEG